MRKEIQSKISCIASNLEKVADAIPDQRGMAGRIKDLHRIIDIMRENPPRCGGMKRIHC